MTTEVSQKDKVILIVLGIVLVVVIFVQLLIRPLLTRASEAKEQLETLNQQYSDLLLQSQSYDTNVAALENWKEKNSEETKRLFPLSDPERIDSFLTFVMHECGVNVNGLTMGQTMQYYIDGEGNLITANPSEVGAADAAASADTTSSNSATTDGNAEGGASYTATGEYCCDFTYTMEGTYEDMTQMLNFVNQVSFLGITAYSFDSVEKQETADSTAEETTGFQDWYSFTLTITAYMYESPLETEETEETTAAANETSEETQATEATTAA